MKINRIGNISIRKIIISDAENYMNLLRCLDGESNFLFFDKNERSGNLEKYSDFIRRILSHDKSIIFVAESDSDGLVGFICGEVLDIKKRSHLMTVSMGVIKKYQLGIGRKLAELLLSHALRNGVMRLEGYVMETNKKCLNLAKKFGFTLEGVKKSSVKINNGFVNECIIGLVYE